jgi:hypothetical protein
MAGFSAGGRKDKKHTVLRPLHLQLRAEHAVFLQEIKNGRNARFLTSR